MRSVIKIVLIAVIFLAGQASPALGLDAITLSAVAPGEIGDSSKVTVEISGAGFTPATTFQLIDSGSAIHSPSRSLFISESRALASFNLAAAADGFAKIKALRGAESAELIGGVEIVSGLVGKLAVSVTGAAAIEAGKTTALVIQYGNSGGADLEIPLLRLTVPGAAFLSTEPDGSNLGQTAMILGLPQSPLYPMLRPGEFANVTLYIQAAPPITPRVVAVSPADPALAAVPLDFSSLGGGSPAWSDYRTALVNEHGQNLGQFFQRAIDRIGDLVESGAHLAYKSAANINGRWYFKSEAAPFRKPRLTITARPYLPAPATVPVSTPHSTIAGDGVPRLWVVIISDSEYTETPLGAWFNPSQFQGSFNGAVFSAHELADSAISGAKVYNLFRLALGLPNDQIIWLNDRPGDSFTLTPAAITAAFASLNSKADGDDQLVVWYSGHAMPPEPGALFAQGTWLLNGGAVYTSENLSMAADAIGAGANLLFVESEFSGAFIDRLTSANTAAFSAAETAQNSFDSPLGGGLFTNGIIDGLLAGKGVFQSFSDARAEMESKGGGQDGGTNAPNNDNSLFVIDTNSNLSTVVTETQTVVEPVLDDVNPNNLTPLAGGELQLNPYAGDGSVNFMPGGVAVCPWSSVVYVTDNSNGKLLMYSPYQTKRKVTLLEGLQNPGDVDIGCGGRSLVYSHANRVEATLFGFTARFHDNYAAPISGANVLITGQLGQLQRRSDMDGLVTVMNVIDPAMTNYTVGLKVDYQGRSQQFRLDLNRSCQTYRSFTFTGSAGVHDPDPTIEPMSSYKPPRGACKGAEWDEPVVTPPRWKYVTTVFPGSTTYIGENRTTWGKKAPLPPSAPVVEIYTPADGLETGNSTQVVSGHVSDTSITQVTIEINGTEITAPVTDGSFYLEAALAAGSNKIIARATGSNGMVGQSGETEVQYTPGYSGGKGAVSGTIKDEDTGAAAVGLQVTEEESGRETATDSNGNYSFTGIDSGKVTISVE